MPASPTALDRALGEAELRKAKVLAGLFAVATLLTLAVAPWIGDAVARYTDRGHLRYLLPLAPLAYVAIEVGVWRRARWQLDQHGRVHPGLSTLAVVVENLLPSLTLALGSAFVPPESIFVGPQLLIFAHTVPLSALRLDPRLCVLAGAVAAGGYVALWAILDVPVRSLATEPFSILIRAGMMLAAGFVAAALAYALRRSFVETLQAAQERARVEQVFGRYLTDEVVEVLLRSPDGLQLGGEAREITMLMSDLRQFSTLSTRLGAQQVVQLLNHYLEIMTRVVQDHGGTLDEIIGDALFVLFGAPLSQADHAERAVRCALAMQAAMAEVNAWNAEQGLPTLEMGIGVHTGTVVVGNIGSELRQKYGVVGPAVNLTARIEGYTTGGQILLSGETASRLGDALAAASEREVTPKGSAGPVRIVEVASLRG